MGKRVKDEVILDLVEKGLSISDIARTISLSKASVNKRVKKLGVKEQVFRKLSIEERERVFTEKVRNKYKGFQYHSGYEHCEASVYIIHTTCGNVHQRNANFIRSKSYINCPFCTKKKDKHVRSMAREIRVLERERKRVIKNIEAMRSKLEKELNSFKKCLCCGEFFKDTKRKYCSVSCSNKQENRKKEVTRRKKMYINGDVDYSISLDKLFKRDKGTCHICKNKVDMDLHTNHDEYGSIDHVIPVAKGGTHTWDNVKLAHRICNSLKRDNEIVVEKVAP